MKLSRTRTLSNRRRRVNQQRTSRKLSGLSTNEIIDPDNTLLGNLFISSDEEGIKDITNNYQLNTQNVTISEDPHGVYNDPCFSFSNTSHIEIIKFAPHLGIEDFTIDWWEYIPKDDHQNTKTIFSLSNSKTPPLLITNDKYNKNIFITSTGHSWDIENKFIGEIVYDRWCHWAVARCNKNFYTYRDGELTNLWVSELPLDNANSNFIIGSKREKGFKGYICNFRLTLDAILWTEEFKTTRSELFY